MRERLLHVKLVYLLITHLAYKSGVYVNNGRNNMAKWESVVESKNWDPTKVIDPQEDFLVDKKKPSYLYYKKSNSP